MNPTSPFEIVRRQKTLNSSGVFVSAAFALISGSDDAIAAAAGTETAKRGIPVGVDPNNPEGFILAGPNNFVGHLTRRVVIGGLTLSDRIFGVTSAVPVGLESPFVDGAEVTAELAQTIEAEGSDYLLNSGTGLINSSTPVPSKLSFNNGRLSVAQANETPFYLLVANNLDATDGVSLRIRAERI